jgi:putative adhesin
MRPMHFTRFVGLTGILAGCGLILAAAPNRPQAPPSLPLMPAMPVMPAMPSIPAMPPIPALPALPEMASFPALPEFPAMPTMPNIDDSVEEAPLPPEPPMAPEAADFGYGSHHDEAATTCSDLHVQFDSEPPIMDSEERTLTKSEASTLRIDNLVNAGVQGRGWDKDTYSVTACKFADSKDRDAKALLSQIKMSIEGGHVSVSGPNHSDHERWAVQLLVRTPRGANLEIKTQNGPASFSEVDGKIHVRAENGPVSMSNCTGEADVASKNGPISISGKSGKLRLHTENGPISVALQSPNWTDGGLVADAVNGPVSLSVPTELNTSFLLESTGHSPITCNASVCKSARKTFDDNDNRRIEYGSGAPVIRLSTVNGPVTVSAL